MANINLISGGVVPTAFLIGDLGQAPGGSADALPTLTVSGGKPVSAGLEIQSTLGGLLLPRMTTTQRNALNATNGLMIYNTTTNTFDLFQATVWTPVNSAFDATQFILATASATFPNAQSLGVLTSGLLKNTVSASVGTLSTAVAGTDYYSPGNPTTIIDTGTGSSITDNLFVGTLCGNASVTGINNTGLGVNCMTAITSGNNNVCVGYQAGLSLTTQSNNVIIGTQAGESVVSPGNVLIGYQAGKVIANVGGGNVAAGIQALVLATSALDTVAIGADAGALQTTYTNCTFIGSGADASANSLTNSTAIGNNATVAVSNAMVLGNGSVNVGIGTSSPSEVLHISGGNVRIDSANALKLYNAGNTHFSALKSANVGSDITWTLPSSDSANYLQSNGSGTLSFGAITALGTVTGLAAFAGPFANYASTYTTGTASQSTTTVTGSGTTFTVAMVGGVIVFANGTYGFITAFGSTTSLTVDSSQTVTGQAYTIYYNGLISSNAGNAGANNLYFSGNGVTSYVPAPLNYYETATLSGNWTGPVTVAGNIYLTRVGNVVTARLQSVSGTSGSSTMWTFSVTVPSRFLPTTNANSDLFFPYVASLNGVISISSMRLYTQTATIGTFIASYGATTLGNFTSGQTCAIEESGFSWVVQ